nr:hypothetical protein BaRGS_032237 [Batillaria attramentaria]
MSIPTVALFAVEVRGYSKLYDNVGDSPLGVGVGWFWVVVSCFTFIAFTDACIYWIHRFLHHRTVYKHLHKIHHTWKITYLALFVFVNIWTVSIHDGDYRVPAPLQPFVNGCAHHTDHHLFYNYNYVGIT